MPRQSCSREGAPWVLCEELCLGSKELGLSSCSQGRGMRAWISSSPVLSHFGAGWQGPAPQHPPCAGHREPQSSQAARGGSGVPPTSCWAGDSQPQPAKMKPQTRGEQLATSLPVPSGRPKLPCPNGAETCMEMGLLLQNTFSSSSFQGPQPRAAFGQREGIQQAWLPRPTCFETVGNKFSLKSFTAENEGKRCWGDGDKHAPAPLESATTAKPGSQLGEARSRDGNWDRQLSCSHNKSGTSWQPGTFVPCDDSGWLQDSVSRRFPRHRTRAVHAQRTPHHTRLPLGAKVSSRSFPARRSAGSGAGVACVSTRAESRQRLQTQGSTAAAVPAPPGLMSPSVNAPAPPGLMSPSVTRLCRATLSHPKSFPCATAP